MVDLVPFRDGAVQLLLLIPHHQRVNDLLGNRVFECVRFGVRFVTRGAQEVEAGQVVEVGTKILPLAVIGAYVGE